MQSTPAQFKENARRNVGDTHLRSIVRKATLQSLTKRTEVVAEISDWEDLRQRGYGIRRRSIMNLDMYLQRLEIKLRENGVEVLWAKNAIEACTIIGDILREAGAKHVVKSKSMVTEEIGLNQALEQQGIDVVETDLGEYIVQLAGETPSHITAPALHKSKEDVGKLFTEKLNLPYTADPAELTKHARTILRDKFLQADAGISGANFIVAETGTIVLVENEGNGCLTTTLPKIHIAITGIEKVVPALDDVSVLLKVLPRSATGQRITSYVSFINSPRKDNSTNGPERVILVLLDNGRSEILRSPEMREALYCIRCGACMNICPVFQIVGGHAYGSTYPGPIGSVLTPLLSSLSEAKDLPFASSLCSACSEICPVKIDIHHMLLWLRSRVVKHRLNAFGERLIVWLWRIAMQSPAMYRFGSSVIRTLFPKSFNVPIWSRTRDFPPIAKKTFHELWKNKEIII